LGLSYRNLASIEEPKTPEYKMLEKYRKTRIVSRSLGYGSLACLVAGFALPSITNNDKLNNAAPGIAAIGFGAVIGWLCVIGPNQARLLKSVLIADKSYKKGRNKR